jgi:hypothetical protein
MTHHVKLVDRRPELQGDWNGPFWGGIETISLGSCRPESSSHRPTVEARLAHDGTRLFGIFDVQDRFVRCTQTEFQGEVWKDSCVEIFLRPPGDFYFNFEFNCGGALRCSFRHIDGIKPPEFLRQDRKDRIQIFHSLPSLIEPEIAEETRWRLEFAIPIEVIGECLRRHLRFSGTTWHGNLYKCADESSHPHWLSWAPVPELNFHRPDYFGELIFS